MKFTIAENGACPVHGGDACLRVVCVSPKQTGNKLVDRLNAKANELNYYAEEETSVIKLLREAADALEYLGEERRAVEREVRGGPADFR